MLYSMGRVLQVIGMTLLPFAMAGNLADQLALGPMLALAGLGVAVFTLGWLLQQAGKKG